MIVPANAENIRRAAGELAAGGLVAFPTETVYGLGADAFNQKALERVFEVKKRPFFDPLIIHIAKIETLNTVARVDLLGGHARELLDTLMRAFWPGPLTLILPRNSAIPAIAAGGLGTVAVRMPAHPAALELIRLGPAALAAPSANPFGYLSPTRAEHVAQQLGDAISLILDGGKTGLGVESTVLDLCGPPESKPTPPEPKPTPPFRLLREGGIPREALEAFTGPLAGGVGFDSGGAKAAGSPGNLKSHYAPRIKLYLHSAEDMGERVWERGAAYLFYARGSLAAFARKNALAPDENGLFALAEEDDPAAAAANLFELLHHIDALDYRVIHAERAPERGLGAAINERLFKAAGSPSA